MPTNRMGARKVKTKKAVRTNFQDYSKKHMNLDFHQNGFRFKPSPEEFIRFTTILFTKFCRLII